MAEATEEAEGEEVMALIEVAGEATEVAVVVVMAAEAEGKAEEEDRPTKVREIGPALCVAM